MKNTLIEIERLLSAAFADFVLSRKERSDLREALSSITLELREKQLLWHFCKSLAEKSETLSTYSSIEWMYACGKLLQQTAETPDAETQVYFSPGTACQTAICNAIRFAKSKIDICVFTISDNTITDELLQAHRLGKHIRIITDNDKTEDHGSDIDLLANAGLQVREDRTDAHMHHKFALFDNEKLLTGSYNWTRSAMTHNLENILLTDDENAIGPFKKEFKRLWEMLK